MQHSNDTALMPTYAPDQLDAVDVVLGLAILLIGQLAHEHGTGFLQRCGQGDGALALPAERAIAGNVLLWGLPRVEAVDSAAHFAVRVDNDNGKPRAGVPGVHKANRAKGATNVKVREKKGAQGMFRNMSGLKAAGISLRASEGWEVGDLSWRKKTS